MPRYPDPHQGYPYPTAVCVGSFDGLHRGHRFLLDRLQQEARTHGLESLAFTFDPHPALVLRPRQAPRLLTDRAEKTFLFDRTPIDRVVFYPFTRDFAALTGYAFLELLTRRFGMKLLLLGHDHRFGSDGLRHSGELAEIGRRLGFELRQAPVYNYRGQRVSSTLIRKWIGQGQMERANDFLGYDYLLSGTVVHGNRFGRKLGFPTANIRPGNPHKLIPPAGVYAVQSLIHGQWVPGVMNIGRRPTIGGREYQIEIHFPGIRADLYDRFLITRIHAFLRPEQKFASLELLRRQIERDIKRMRQIWPEF